jgi:starvation-inducible DNA-binding protein
VISHLLADTYTLYLKTHNYHWNVTGPMFNTFHLMFETQYPELALSVVVGFFVMRLRQSVPLHRG